MKKILLTISAILLTCSFLQAQKAKFGFTVGGAISNYHFIVDGESANGKAVVGVTAGILTDIPLSGDFSFQPALNFIQKGTKDESSENNVAEKIVLHTYHAELLLNFLYNAPTKDGSFFIGAGPSVSMGIFGKWKDTYQGQTEKADVQFGNGDDDDIKPFDLGANITAGFRFPKGVFIAANYNQGLNNLIPGGSDNGKVKSHYIGLRIGFLLNGKK